MMMNIETLVLKIQNNEEPWDTLYNLENSRILYWCNGDEDLAQSAWLKIYQNIDKYDPSRPFLSWAKSVVTNLVIDEYRVNSRMKLENMPYLNIESDEESPDEYLEKKEILDIVAEVVKEICSRESKYSKYLKLYSQGYSYKDISTELGVPLGTVQSTIFHAKKVLTKELKRIGITEFPFDN